MERPKLQVVFARYEAIRNPDPCVTRIVTLQIQALVTNDNKLCMKNEFNRYFGDPVPGVQKQLVIVFQVGNAKPVEMKWIEGGGYVNVCAEDFVPRKQLSIKLPPSQQFGTLSYGEVPMCETAFPYEALSVIMSFLPIFPDRMNCLLVCREFKHSLSNTGLTEEFHVGYAEDSSCYLHQPCSFVSLIVSKSTGSLRVLNLSGYSKLNDTALLEILRMNLSRLVVLDLADCVQLTDLSVGQIALSLRGLKALTLKRLFKLTDVSLEPIVTNCLLLERLDVSEVRNLTDFTAQHLHHLRHLRALFLRENHRVTNNGMREFFSPHSSQDHKLKELSVWGLHRLTFADFTFSFAHLRALNLEGCISIDDHAMETIAESCGHLLLALSLKYCHKLSDRAVETVATKLPSLQHLNLAYVCRMTDYGLDCITAHLFDLRSLDMSHCFKLTHVAISNAIERLGMLSELKLRACKQAKVQPEQVINTSISLLDLRDCGNSGNNVDFTGFVNAPNNTGCFIKAFRL